MAGKFSLKWNEFQTNAAASFKRLRNEDDFYDVTLVSDDQQQLSAHKLVLSSCSDYFKNILKRNKNSHLTLCLEGISFKTKTKKYENASTKTIIATNIDNEADVDQMIIENIVENEDGKKCCGVCGKTSKTTQDLKRHVETHIDGLSFSCQKCDKTFRSRESRRRHIMIIHSIQV